MSVTSNLSMIDEAECRRILESLLARGRHSARTELEQEMNKFITRRFEVTNGGVLLPGRIPSALTGETQVFRRFANKQLEDLSTWLFLLDASGSMAGRYIALASAAVWWLGKVMERVHQDYKVAAFHSPGDTPTIEIIKDWREPLSALRLISLTPYWDNHDYTAIEWGIQELERQHKSHKFMVIFTDANPCGRDGDQHLREAIRKADTKGVIIAAFGPGSTGSARCKVDRYYTYWGKGWKTNDVPNAMAGAVLSALRDHRIEV